MTIRSGRILPGLIGHQEQEGNQENVEAAGYEGGQGHEENDSQAHHEIEEQGEPDHPENSHEPQEEENRQEFQRQEEKSPPVKPPQRQDSTGVQERPGNQENIQDADHGGGGHGSDKAKGKRPIENPSEGDGNAADRESKKSNIEKVGFPEDTEILKRLREFLLQNNQEYPSAENYPVLIMAAHYVDSRFDADTIIKRFEASRNSYLDALRNPAFEPRVQGSTELFFLCMEIWGCPRDNYPGTGTSDESGSSSAYAEENAEENILQQIQEKEKGKRPIDDPDPKKKTMKKDPGRADSIRQDIRSWARRLDSLFPPSRTDVSFRVPKKIWTGVNGLLPPATRKRPKFVLPEDASSSELPGLSLLLDVFMDIHKHIKNSAREHLKMNKGVPDWFKSLNDYPESSITVKFPEDNSWDDIPMSEMAKKILKDDESEKSSADKNPRDESHDKELENVEASGNDGGGQVVIKKTLRKPVQESSTISDSPETSDDGTNGDDDGNQTKIPSRTVILQGLISFIKEEVEVQLNNETLVEFVMEYFHGNVTLVQIEEQIMLIKEAYDNGEITDPQELRLCQKMWDVRLNPGSGGSTSQENGDAENGFAAGYGGNDFPHFVNGLQNNGDAENGFAAGYGGNGFPHFVNGLQNNGAAENGFAAGYGGNGFPHYGPNGDQPLIEILDGDEDVDGIPFNHPYFVEFPDEGGGQANIVDGAQNDPNGVQNYPPPPIIIEILDGDEDVDGIPFNHPYFVEFPDEGGGQANIVDGAQNDPNGVQNYPPPPIVIEIVDGDEEDNGNA